MDKQVAQYIADGWAPCHLTLDADGLTNYRECSWPLGLADRRKISIAGYGDLTVAFRSNDSWVHVKLHDVAHAPLLSCNLVSLTSLAQESHPSTVEESGVTLKLKGGGAVQFSLIGNLCRQYGYRPEATGRMVNTAVIVPGQAKAPTTPTDINLFHCTCGHTHEALLKQMAKQQEVSLNGELHDCRGCSMAKGLRKPIARSTDTRADKKHERVFVDLSGKMAIPSIGGKRYTLIVRDDHTRFTRVYFLAKKSDAASAFESFPAEVRAGSTPSAVMCVRSDNGGECFRGEFGTLCRKRGIKRESTPADSPKSNGVAKKALALISDTALAARIQAQVLYPGALYYPSLWAEAVSWVCNALNCTATKENPGNESSYKMWYGSPPLAGEA